MNFSELAAMLLILWKQQFIFVEHYKRPPKKRQLVNKLNELEIGSSVFIIRGVAILQSISGPFRGDLSRAAGAGAVLHSIHYMNRRF